MEDQRYTISTRGCVVPLVNCYDHKTEVYTSKEFDLVLHNTGYVGFRDHRIPTGYRLLERRAELLMENLLDNPQLLLGETEKWLAFAFQKTDDALEEMLVSENCSPFTPHAEEMWRTRFNSLVIVVDRVNQRVEVAGCGLVEALILKAGKKMMLTDSLFFFHAELRREHHFRPDDISADVVIGTQEYIELEDGAYDFIPCPIDEHKQLFFHSQVPLEPEHEYVMLAPEDYVSDGVRFKLGFLYRKLQLEELPSVFPDDMSLEEAIRESVRQCPQTGRINVFMALRVKLSDRKRRVGSGGSISNKCLKSSLYEHGPGSSVSCSFDCNPVATN